MHSNQQYYLFKLWQELLYESQLPQLDKWVSKKFKLNKKFGKKDRAWYSEVLFNAIRNAYFILFCQWAWEQQDISNRFSIEQTFKITIHSPEQFWRKLQTIPAEVFFYWLSLKITSLNISFKKNHKQEAFYQDLVALLQQSTDLSTQMLFTSVPLWLETYLAKRALDWTEEQTQYFLQQLQYRPPIWLRIHRALDYPKVIQELTDENFSILSQEALTIAIQGEKSLFLLNSYKNGYFEIQDYASQQIAMRIKPSTHALIWDTCAGGGGKTIQLAAMLNNQGAIYASDIRSYKFDEIKRRAKKAQFFNIRYLAWDGESLPQFPKEVIKNTGFNWILIDAPCSSSGTWRRNPDAKYKINKTMLDDLNKIQLMLLKHAYTMLHPEGKLVYATCSWLLEENELIIKRFLEEHPQFRLEEQSLLGYPQYNADTTFVAVLSLSS